MSNRALRTAALLSLGGLAVAALPSPLVLLPGPPAADPVLKEADHKKVGSKIQEWIEAKVENEGVSEAAEELWEEVDKWSKKKPVKDLDPLSLTADLGRALWWANEYDRQKGIVKGKVKTEDEEEYRGSPLPYTIHAPAKYSPKEAYPLVMIIADEAKEPFQELTESWTDEGFRDSAILLAVHMPEKVESWTEIRDAEGKAGGIAVVLQSFGMISKKYAIDFDKVFLAGRGMAGVQAAMVCANMFPDRFAGVLGRTGDMKELAIDNFRNLPTYFVGAGDGATKFQEAVQAAGWNNCTVNPTGTEADMWKWIDETTRVGTPTEVVLQPGTPFPNRAYWLEVPPWDGTGVAHVKGTVNREENTITIEGKGVVSVSIAFNDDLVDMNKEIKVICNGVVNVDMVPRNRDQTLTYIYNTRNDPGKFYTARKEYGLPAVAGEGKEGE